MLQALRDFWTRNVVISNWEKISVFWSPIDYFRGTVGSILSINDVNNKIFVDLDWDIAFKDDKLIEINSPYSIISQREFSIQNLKNEILYTITLLWAIPKESVPDLQYLLENWYLTKVEIIKACVDYFLLTLDNWIKYLNTPKNYWTNDNQFLKYPDIIHNLELGVQNMIAYLIKEKKVTERQLWSLDISLKRWWDDLEYFMKTCYDKTFFDNFIDDLMKWERTYL